MYYSKTNNKENKEKRKKTNNNNIFRRLEAEPSPSRFPPAFRRLLSLRFWRFPVPYPGRPSLQYPLAHSVLPSPSAEPISLLLCSPEPRLRKFDIFEN